MFSFTTIRAFTVHIFTACGAALALLALILATGSQWAAMFFCLGLALIVDAVDGPLARMFKVGEVLPRWSGDTLDLVVDYTTYVFVPAYVIAASGYLPHLLTIPCALAIVITGTLYFADRNMKTDDNYFRGFPGLWNLAAFYLFVLEPPEWAAAAGVVALCVLTFVPFRFVHPLRVRFLRPLNIALLGAWGALALVALADNLAPDPAVRLSLAAIAVYFFVVGFLRRPAEAK